MWLAPYLAGGRTAFLMHGNCTSQIYQHSGGFSHVGYQCCQSVIYLFATAPQATLQIKRRGSVLITGPRPPLLISATTATLLASGDSLPERLRAEGHEHYCHVTLKDQRRGESMRMHDEWGFRKCPST